MSSDQDNNGAPRLAPRPVSRPQVDAASRQAFSRPDGVQGSFVAERVRPQSMAQTVGDLEAEGMVDRNPDPDDRRGVLVSLTKRGLKTVDQAVEDHLANEAGLLEALTDRERRALDGALTKLLKAWGA